MSDSIIDQIKAAQAGPAENYMVWAEIGRGEKVEEVILHSVRLPQSIGADEVLSRTRKLSETTLADCGFSAAEIARAKLHITLIPPADEVIRDLKARGGPDVAFVTADLTLWEACRHRLNLEPYTVNGNDEEMNFEGLKIRRSVAG